MSLQQHQSLHSQTSALLLDGLYCEEEGFEEDYSCETEIFSQNVKNESSLCLVLLDQDLFWEDDELFSLICKEKDTHFRIDDGVIDEGSLSVARKEAIEWVLKVKAHYGFTALTCVLAANYFDRFISGFKFKEDKPWMGQLVAVACLSLAAKVEETQVPLLLDLQVEDSKYVFEAKTIKRMELLVLSTIQWRMNPVTPISFFDHIVRRLGLKNHQHWEFLWRCERLLLSIITDSRFIGYLPSIMATSVMMHVIEEVEPYNQVEYQSQLLDVLKVNEDKLKECYKLISELSGSQNRGRKRKHLPVPGSPNGVIDALFNSDCSNESWAVESTVSPSSVPSFKRSRSQDQHMPLPSLNRMFVNVLESPR